MTGQGDRVTPVDRLRRWEEMGAPWRVTSRTSTQLAVALLTCDGGEEVDVVVSGDPDLFAYVAGRSDSES